MEEERQGRKRPFKVVIAGAVILVTGAWIVVAGLLWGEKKVIEVVLFGLPFVALGTWILLLSPEGQRTLLEVDQAQSKRTSFWKRFLAMPGKPQQVEWQESLDKCGPPRMPCLYHSALNPYRPILKIHGEPSKIVSELERAGIRLSEEMQGDRFGSVTVNGRLIPFGLIVAVRNSDEMFIEVQKPEDYDFTQEMADLRCIHGVICNLADFPMELLEK